MKKIFIGNQNAYTTSEQAVQYVLSQYFHLPNAQIERGDHGKPFLVGGKEIPLFFSVSHTNGLLFITFSDENVGIDAEHTARQANFASIVKRFSQIERAEIATTQDFLRHWIVKESAVKWLGGSLASDLHKLRYEKGVLWYGEIELPAKLTLLTLNDCFIAVCSERDFTNAEITYF